MVPKPRPLVFRDFHSTLPPELPTENLHIRVLYKIPVIIGELAVLDEKNGSLYLHGRNLNFLWNAVRGEKQESPPQKICTISWRDNAIWELRRTGILRKPLFIREKIE
jgi:hypothetical protein